MPEYWDLWQRNPETWNALVRQIGEGVLPVANRVRTDFPRTELLPNRWDVPGFDLLIPPRQDETGDGAWRTVQVYADTEHLVPHLQFGGAAWFDEQGDAPSEPWTRWWCHTKRPDESRWQTPLSEVEDPALPGQVERTLVQIVELVLDWRWVEDQRRWV